MSKKDAATDPDTIYARHNSLGAAIQANDVEWADLYLAKTDERYRPTPAQLTTLMFKTLDDLEPATMDWLLANGADATHQQQFTLPDRQELVGLPRLLIDHGCDKLFKHLFEKGVIKFEDRSVGGNSLLAQALAKSNIELADWLFERKASVDQANFLGFTALHQAAARVDFLAAEWLLDHGANPELGILEDGNVPSQMIPTADDTGDNDALYDILEDYSESFAQGAPQVPPALRDRCDALRAEIAAEKAETEQAQPARKPRP